MPTERIPPPASLGRNGEAAPSGVEVSVRRKRKYTRRKKRVVAVRSVKPHVIQSAQTVVIHQFSHLNPLSWALMPKFLERLSTFCITHQTDTTPEQLIPNVRVLFALGAQNFAGWGVLDGGTIIGHLLAQVETQGAATYCLIYQAEMDGVNYEATKAVFAQCQAWAAEKKRTEIRMVTYRKPEGFERRWGFEIRHYVMRYQSAQESTP